MPGGRVLHVYDTGPATARLTVFWHHAARPISVGLPRRRCPSPNAWASGGSYDRPGYGTFTPVPGRTAGSAAGFAGTIADALGIDAFAVMGHSGGASHALACGALLPDRVIAVAALATVAPVGAPGLDWFAGMAAASAASLRAAVAGWTAKEKYEASTDVDPAVFTTPDAPAARRTGPDDPRAPQRVAGRALPDRRTSAEPGGGHLSVLNRAAEALDWLAAR